MGDGSLSSASSHLIGDRKVSEQDGQVMQRVFVAGQNRISEAQPPNSRIDINGCQWKPRTRPLQT
jgi:hypothetical protein